MRTSLFAAIAAGTVLFSGCANNEEPARQALAAAEASLAEVRVDAAKYAPQELESAEARLARAKEDLAKKEYKDVLGGATQLSKETAALKEVVVSKQTQAVAATHEWEALSEEVPKMVETIDKRVAELDKKKMFRGIKKEDFESAKATFASMKSTWAEASTDHSAGKPVAATTKAKSAKSMGDQLYETLDIKKT